MPSPKSVSLGSPAPPAEPAEPAEPINAEAGSMTQVSASPKAKTATSATPAPSFEPVSAQKAAEEGKKLHFIKIVLLDQDNDPVPNEAFRITMPDGSVQNGTLDAKGSARIDGIPDAGTCKVTFPARDKSTWDKK